VSPIYGGVIGIDLSLTSTGLVRLERDGTVDHQSAIPTSPKSPLQNRQLAILEAITAVMEPVDLVVIEGPSLGKFIGKAWDRAELAGIVKFRIWRIQDRYPLIIPPTMLKKFATGVGVGEKPAMAVAAFKRFGWEHKSNDVTDAFLLAQLGQMLVGRGPTPLAREAAVLKAAAVQLRLEEASHV
jgi:crossover junction endodeoxyribonuclease RuvC